MQALRRVCGKEALEIFLSCSWFPQNQTNSNCVSTGQKKIELRHSGSSQSPRGKAQREVSGSTAPLPLHLDLTKVTSPHTLTPGHFPSCF